MATVRARRQSDGTIRYCAVIRIRKGKAIIHQEYKTFTHRSAALSWAKHREVELEKDAIPGLKQHAPVTLAELIRWYIDTFEPISKWQRSKQSHLEFLERHALGKVNALELTAAALIKRVRARRADGAGPATVINDLIWIRVVLRAAKNVKEIPVRPEIAQEARSACGELRLIFAIASARREAEICRLEWHDNAAATRTGVVRDAKHPTAREGNHRRFRYTPEAWAIVEAQPRQSPYIFPYDPKSVGSAFTRACQLLGIKDLRFHDLRHEATSRLFERGSNRRSPLSRSQPAT